jgi:phosphopantetheine adenylyltransferase
MTTLQDIKRLYREVYVRILENENRRGFTSTKERKELERLRKLINEGENNGKLQSDAS